MINGNKIKKYQIKKKIKIIFLIQIRFKIKKNPIFNKNKK